MRLGISVTYKKADLAKAAGFDYFEYNCADLYNLSDDEYAEALATVRKLDFYAEAMCVMLKPEIKVTGFDVDLEHIVKPYLQKVFARAHGLGCKKIVFGSSRSRNMPENFWDRRKAYDQIVEYLHMASDMMLPYGMEVVIEPCPNPENNILTFVSEGNYVMKLVDRPNVWLLADTYLMQANYESVWEILAYAPSLRHIHTSAPDRNLPYAGDGFDYTELFKAIKQSGYDGTITIEAFHPETNLAERMIQAYQLLKTGLQ